MIFCKFHPTFEANKSATKLTQPNEPENFFFDGQWQRQHISIFYIFCSQPTWWSNRQHWTTISSKAYIINYSINMYHNKQLLSLVGQRIIAGQWPFAILVCKSVVLYTVFSTFDTFLGFFFHINTCSRSFLWSNCVTASIQISKFKWTHA